MTVSKVAEWYNPASWADSAAQGQWDSRNSGDKASWALNQYLGKPAQHTGWSKATGWGAAQDWLGSLVSDEKRKALTQQAKKHIYGGGFRDMVGGSDDPMAGASSYLPMLAGAGATAYGLASGNPMAAVGGLAGIGGGLYNAWNAGKDLQNKQLVGQAAGGLASSDLVRDAARGRLRKSYNTAMPVATLAKSFGIDLMPKKLASYSDRFRANFQMANLIEELAKDRNIDSRTAAELIVAGHRAQALDNRPDSIIGVGEFAREAAKGFGYEMGRNIGSLMTIAPAVKSVLRRIGGGGLFSGAKALGVL